MLEGFNPGMFLHHSIV
uniref:Uncharacterized protein n=1 Tax=Lepeophtheirus salmonis TaxID=72036 RepID=A0A0K2TCG0_LEPSM